MRMGNGLSWVGAVGVLTVGIGLGCLPQLYAQVILGDRTAVGGVLIDVDGVVSAPQVAVQQELQVARQKALDEIPGDLNQSTPLRKVSLRKLEEAIRAHGAREVESLPDDVKYLAGLQRVRYVFVFPDDNDIILAGPAEGWKVDALGNVVGQTTGRPVLLLEDLLVALRTARTSAQTGMSCSIDPTADGIKRLRTLTRRLQTIGNPEETLHLIEEALGSQVVSINGVPASTHFARVMLAADFRMKRLAMNFEPSPIPNLPSYLHLLKRTRHGMQNMLPRWWLAPDYEPLRTDPEGLSWEIRGQGVKCMTEEDFVLRDGTRQPTGQAGSSATQWATSMTARFEELAGKDSAFGQLRNVMDLAVVAALIEKEKLLDRANVALPYMTQDGEVTRYCEPRQVASQTSVLQKGQNWLISASGGVQIYPWEIADKTATDGALTPVRKQSDNRGSGWWWN